MASVRSGPAVLRAIQQVFGPGTASGLSEWQLLDRYASRGDEAAFEALVTRHGPMVLGVCRRLLRDPADVEDAFQATFLVLVRKAGTLGERDLLARWLYGVAHRVALRARSDAARRGARERTGIPVEPAAAAGDPDGWELAATLLEEVRRLPEKYRSPVVLCYLEGRTHEQAASELRWPVGTVKARLARARDRLRDRLIRRGLAPSAGLLAHALTRDASAAVPELLIGTTARSVRAFSIRGAAAGAIPCHAATLAGGILRTMAMTKLFTLTAAALLAVGLVSSGGAILARQGPASKPIGSQPDPGPEAKPDIIRPGPGLEAKPDEGPPPPAEARTDRPLRHAPALNPTLPPAATPNAPPGRLAERINREVEDASAPISPNAPPGRLAERIFNDQLRLFAGGEVKDAEKLERWSRRIVRASVADGATTEERIAAAEGHLHRMRRVAEAARKQAFGGTMSRVDGVAALFFQAEAERELAAERPGRSAGGTSERAGGTDLKSRAIQAKLESPIAIPFESETPLEDVIKYIKQATADETLPAGLPIYVDPAGLEEAERTMNSTVHLNLEGISLRRGIGLMLGQLGLAFAVDDGLLIISTEGRMAGLKEAGQSRPPSPFMVIQEKLDRGEYSTKELEDLKKQLTLKNEVERLIQGEMPGDPKGRNRGTGGAIGR